MYDSQFNLLRIPVRLAAKAAVLAALSTLTSLASAAGSLSSDDGWQVLSSPPSDVTQTELPSVAGTDAAAVSTQSSPATMSVASVPVPAAPTSSDFGAASKLASASVAKGLAALPAADPATSGPSASVADGGGNYALVAGQSLQTQLEAWAKRAGWSLTWNVSDDWIVPGNQSYGPAFAAAMQHVVEQLALNGADVRADIWSGNQSVVVHPSGATE
jgi:hypothetical protein